MGALVKDEGVRERQHLDPELFPANLHLFSLKDECKGGEGAEKNVRPGELKHSITKGGRGELVQNVCMSVFVPA